MRFLFALTVCFVSLTSTVSASVVCYELHDHPDGNAAPPIYGLRLDGLIGAGVFTFEFDGSSKSSISDWKQMKLVYDSGEGTIRIRGHVYGGLNSGTGYSGDTSKVGTWWVDFTYKVGVTDTIAKGLHVVGENSMNAGTIELVSGSGSSEIGLTDYKGSFDHSLRFDNDFHRMNLGESDDHSGEPAPWLTDGTTYGDIGSSLHHGRGWLDKDGVRPGTMDWLFVGVESGSPFSTVPEPASVIAWLGLGIAGAAGYGIRRRKKAKAA